MNISYLKSINNNNYSIIKMIGGKNSFFILKNDNKILQKNLKHSNGDSSNENENQPNISSSPFLGYDDAGNEINANTFNGGLYDADYNLLLDLSTEVIRQTSVQSLIESAAKYGITYSEADLSEEQIQNQHYNSFTTLIDNFIAENPESNAEILVLPAGSPTEGIYSLYSTMVDRDQYGSSRIEKTKIKKLIYPKNINMDSSSIFKFANHLFWSDYIEEIILPDDITRIDIFSNYGSAGSGGVKLPNVKKIHLPSNLQYIYSDKTAYENGNKTDIGVINNSYKKIEEVIIPSSVVYIQEDCLGTFGPKFIYGYEYDDNNNITGETFSYTLINIVYNGNYTNNKPWGAKKLNGVELGYYTYNILETGPYPVWHPN